MANSMTQNNLLQYNTIAYKRCLMLRPTRSSMRITNYILNFYKNLVCCACHVHYVALDGALLSHCTSNKQVDLGYCRNSPGLKIINPITQRVISIDLKTQTLAIDQQVITKDNVQAKIQSIIFYRIYQPADLVYKLGANQEYTRSCVSEIAIASLRTVAGCLQLQTLIQNREQVGISLTAEINRQVNVWGIVVDVCSIKELFLSKEMGQVLATVASTRRRSEAFLISARANVQCAKMLKQAADILDNKTAMQIRYLETMEYILGNQNNNIIFLNTAQK